MQENKDYSIVIPFYNEEDSVGEVVSLVEKAMRGLGGTYEILAVDDGSTDGTYSALEDLKDSHPFLCPMHLDHNSGQMESLSSGFQRARGDIIISLDGDLQDDPSQIPEMIKAFKEKGVDVLCGWRKERKSGNMFTGLSRIGNFFQKMFLNVPVHDISCTFRVYTNAAAKSVKTKKRGFHRFIPFFLKRSGFSIDERMVVQNPRKYGMSKYTFSKSLDTIILFFTVIFGKY